MNTSNRSIELNAIHHGDCLTGMAQMTAGSVDLAFADPPFNIGYEYDLYEDKLEKDHYLDWSRAWMTAVFRVLKEDGTFWLAIGDEYAAELKVIAQEIGFIPRSWVIWYYTFGVNCKHKYSRSHAHLLYFVKDAENFTFRDDDLQNRIPSARQLVYNDKRANPQGRLPDDTWIIRPENTLGELADETGQLPAANLLTPHDNKDTWTLRPQDLENCFQSEEDTWYFPRVAGTFKERAGFHGCQMPEQLLGRIVRCCSEETDLVMDPFTGSATTLAVARKLGRRYLGFELSEDYVQHAKERLRQIKVGDRLDGSAEPLMSAPKTGENKNKVAAKATKPNWNDTSEKQRQQNRNQLQLTLSQIKQNFIDTHHGFSLDRVLSDPELMDQFHERCRTDGLAGEPTTWNRLLLRMRKAGQLSDIPTTRRTELTWTQCDSYLQAAEIVWRSLTLEKKASTLSEILTDSLLAGEFDHRANALSPGGTPFEYRWSALKIEKQAKTAISRGALLSFAHDKEMDSVLREETSLDDEDNQQLPQSPAIYLIKSNIALYAGETLDLQARFSPENWTPHRLDQLPEFSEPLTISFRVQTPELFGQLAWQSCLVTHFQPRFNTPMLSSPQ